MDNKMQIAEKLIWLRLCNMIVNEHYKNKEFDIPIHLAMGHEAIAVAVSVVKKQNDQLVLSHRNIHYNLALSNSLKPILDEYFVKKEGIGDARLGSMNLANYPGGVLYTSSILGNNLCVAPGIALAMKFNNEDGIIFVETGDGAMEEGAFYECIEFMKSYNLSGIIIIENNDWSLASQIHERRCEIAVSKIAESFGIEYYRLEGNDVFEYIEKLNTARELSLKKSCPVIVEVLLHSLGDWRLKTEGYPDGKYINYHAGPAPTVNLVEWPIIQEDDTDPIYVLTNNFMIDKLKDRAKIILKNINEEIS